MKKHFLFPVCILLAIALVGCFNSGGSQSKTVRQNKANNQTNTAKKVVFKKAEDIEWVEADQSYVFINTSTQITITSEIKENPNLISENVYLYKCDADGNPAENLGRMFDDGTHGDLSADDSRFTTQITFNEKEPKEIKLRLILSYTNAPEKFQSDIIAIQAKIKVDPEEVKNNVIQNLKKGDIDNARPYFPTGEKTERLLSLSAEELNEFADWLEQAEFIKTIGDFRVYRYSWIDSEGDENFVEFRMGLNQEGKWIITGF